MSSSRFQEDGDFYLWRVRDLLHHRRSACGCRPGPRGDQELPRPASQTSFPDQDSAIVLSLSNLVFKACIDPSSSVYNYPVKTYIHLILTAIKSSNI